MIYLTYILSNERLTTVVQSTYELIGGEEMVRTIVNNFYPKVQQHPDLKELFPEHIEPVMEKQFMFLSQFFGGPALFTEQFGHPMMRARHMPFKITEKRALAWLACMKEALQETQLAPDIQSHVIERLSGPAFHFINSDE